ncbi:hypothetical protein SAMN05444349_102224 [Bacteroides faecichinchillae]|jgi:hypothetical protein|uniref:Uncharacterized protein n=1 Tax=Bacteroides faecichinchillae TaxID=871325 RepID=A0A1M4TRY6_9BACE|nr:hypothetical protein SAMN05444349_102224 [Bacteroides faecichinchillae]
MTDKNCIFPIQSENINIQSTRKPLQAFCNISAEISYLQYIVADSGHSTKRLKIDGTTRVCKTMKYNDLHLSLHSMYL